MYTTSSEYSLIKTIVIVVNLLASLKLCNLAVKLPPELFQKKPGPPASSHLQLEVSSLRKANEALSKCWRAKRTRVQLRGSLTLQDAVDLLGPGAVGGEGVQETQPGGSGARGGCTKVRCCGVYSKPSYNACTCQEVAEASDSAVSDVIIVGS